MFYDSMPITDHLTQLAGVDLQSGVLPMFRGLSAFPLSPLVHGALDETAFVRLVDRLVTAGVDSICVLGSTGNYAYLSPKQRARIVRLGVEHAGGVPVIAGVGALATDQVLSHVEAAQEAG